MPSSWATITNNTISTVATMGAGAVGRGAGVLPRGLSNTKSSRRNILNYRAESINSRDALKIKLGALEKANATAARIRNLPDGRIRYYSVEVPSSKLGKPRGASYVTEWNPLNNRVRSWMESYEWSGAVNRVHPKMINGQIIKSNHYPPIGREVKSKS